MTRQGEDLLTNGFVAATRAEERACQGFTVDQLAEITDVTAQVNGAVPAGRDRGPRGGAARRGDRGDPATAATRRRAKTHCEVITMYRGGQYKLYRFRRWTEAKLVFVPETQAASFGGDPDNFTYPRHDLDMSLLRVYENGQPVHPEHYYRWSANGSREGDLVFVVGNPGNTSRLQTIAQLEYLRDVAVPGDALLAQQPDRHPAADWRARTPSGRRRCATTSSTSRTPRRRTSATSRACSTAGSSTRSGPGSGTSAPAWPPTRSCGASTARRGTTSRASSASRPRSTRGAASTTSTPSARA